MSQPIPSHGSVVVVGASLAGLRAAEELRHQGHTGEVIVVGEEHHAPYDRPPLSKQVLSGKWEVSRIHHHAPDVLDTLGIDFRLGCRASSLDTDRRVVSLDDGSELRYDGLIVATGASARRLPGTDGLPGVHTLRTLDDCVAIRADLMAAGGSPRVVVIGAGFIGAEVAATCHGLGAQVTMVEALATPLVRVIGERMGQVCAGLHRDAGVDLRLGVGVVSVSQTGTGTGTVGTTHPTLVRLSDGSELEADVVVVGIGVTPAVEWLEGSGLTLADGVTCSESLFAGDGVTAAGDVARWRYPGLDVDIRLEHWTNAAEGGAAAARSLLAGTADAEAYAPVPFFWSDQYGAKLQVIGLPAADDEVVVVEGSDTERQLVALYRRGDRLAAVLAISRPRQLMAYRPLLAAGASFGEALAITRG